MKKLLTLPITLLACASLLISCGSKKEEKKSEPSSEQQSSEPEPGPGPAPEPAEDEIIFPDNLEDAGFIDMGKLSYNAPDKEFEEQASRSVDIEASKFNHAKETTISYNYDAQQEKAYIDYGCEEFHAYNDGICVSSSVDEDYYVYDGIVSIKSYDYKDTYTYIPHGETLLYKEDASGNGEWHEWGASNYTSKQLVEEAYNYCLSHINMPNQPAFTKIGDFYYVVALDLSVNSNSDYAADGTYFYYSVTEKAEIIIKINSDFLIDDIYTYFQATFDHDPFTGRFVDEPFVVYRYLDLIDLDYGNYEDHPEAQKLLNNIPAEYFYNASLNYRVAPVNLDENGELTAAPEFPENFSTATDTFFENEETAGLLFAPYYQYSNDFAIDLGLMWITYRSLVDGEINQVEIDPRDEAFLESIVEAMGAELKEYDGTTYLVVGIDYNYIDFIFSTLGIESSSEITVQKSTHNLLLI